MDVSLIQESCKQYVGLHDFQNFCKKDHSFDKKEHQVVEYDEEEMYFRRIYSFRIEKVSENKDDPSMDVYMAIIKGSAFLWHQVRYMMAVLFMIGKK